MTAALATATINVFNGSYDAVPQQILSLSQALQDIQTGVHAEAIAHVRHILQTKDKKAYDQAKARLPAYTLCGTFDPRRNIASLATHSGIVHGDLDHLDAATLTSARHALCSDPRVVYCFRSPSEQGLKLGVHVAPVADDAAYKLVWYAIAEEFASLYGIPWDQSGKDICRLCYVSHDADLYNNFSAELFHVIPRPTPIADPGFLVPAPHAQRPTSGFSTDHRTRYAEKAIETAINIIASSVSGNRHPHRLKAARLLGGYVAGGFISETEAYESLANVVERNTDDFQRSMRTIADGLRHGMESPVTFESLEAKRLDWLARQQTSGNGSHHSKVNMSPSEARDSPESTTADTSSSQQQATRPVSLGWNDYVNALALVRDHGKDLHYCYPWKCWLVWNGKHWQRDTNGHVMRLAKQTIKRLATRIAELEDDAEAKALTKHIKESLSTSKLKAMIENAQSEFGIPIQPEDLDRHPWLLNVQNGTIDLRAGIRRAHNRADLLTKCLSYAYDEQATCPTWERFQWQIMGGTMEADNPDLSTGDMEARYEADERARRLIGFKQHAIGYSLTGDTREQCLFVSHGSGSNGKSTELEIIQALLGDYAQSTPSASLLAKDRYDGIPNDIARLRGARLVSAVEIGEGKRLNEELIKRLTGQDTITARFLHEEFFDFKAQFKLFIACNHLPTIRGTDHAIWRRVKLIPFNVTIPEPDQDKDLSAKLRAELPGILAWAVRGCLDWQRNGLGEPDEVKTATASYRTSMDIIGRFIQEECLISPRVQVKATELYQAYKRWCEASGEETVVTSTNFGSRLEERGFTKEKRGIIWRLGIRLNTETEN